MTIIIVYQYGTKQDYENKTEDKCCKTYVYNNNNNNYYYYYREKYDNTHFGKIYGWSLIQQVCDWWINSQIQFTMHLCQVPNKMHYKTTILESS